MRSEKEWKVIVKKAMGHANLAGIHAVARTELGSSRRFNPDVHADFAGKTHMASLVLALVLA